MTSVEQICFSWLCGVADLSERRERERKQNRAHSPMTKPLQSAAAQHDSLVNCGVAHQNKQTLFIPPQLHWIKVTSGFDFSISLSNLQYLVGRIGLVVVEEPVVNHVSGPAPGKRQLHHPVREGRRLGEVLQGGKLQNGVVPEAAEQIHLKHTVSLLAGKDTN